MHNEILLYSQRVHSKKCTLEFMYSEKNVQWKKCTFWMLYILVKEWTILNRKASSGKHTSTEICIGKHVPCCTLRRIMCKVGVYIEKCTSKEIYIGKSIICPSRSVHWKKSKCTLRKVLCTLKGVYNDTTVVREVYMIRSLQWDKCTVH